MSGKTIAAVLIFAALGGAAIGLLARGPGPLSTAGIRLGAPNGQSDAASSAIRPTVTADGYRLCTRDFPGVMTNKTPQQRREACRCFADTYDAWSEGSRKLAEPMIYLRLVELYAHKATRFKAVNTYPRSGSLSAHEISVRRSQSRDIMGQLQRNADRIVKSGGQALIDDHPMRSMLMNLRVRMLLARCDIVDM